MSVYAVGAFVLACIGGMGYIAVLRRKAARADFERMKVRDSLTLIDTHLAIKSSEELTKDLEARRAKAVDEYNRNLWRPGGDSEPKG